MYVTSPAVQYAVIMRRNIMNALGDPETTPEQHESAARELLRTVRGFDADERKMYRQYIAATK